MPQSAGSTPGHLYERIGGGYATKRVADARWAARIHDALGDARSVLNVGAGAGSYEPAGGAVTALEPSPQMIAQRVPGAAPVVRGVAGALPFVDGAFDAAMAVLTVHHWAEAEAGLAEMRRVARRQVIVTWDVAFFARCFWMTRDYLPDVGPEQYANADAAEVARCLGDATVLPLPVPHDCTDGFYAAYWRRPEAYLDPAVRASISGLALLDPATVDAAMTRLRDDLASGAWHERNGELLDAVEQDLGYRLVVAGR